MKKYLLVAKASLQIDIAYKFNAVLGQFVSIVAIYTLYFLYTSVFEGHGELFGFTRDKIIAYVLLANMFFSFLYQYSMHALADGISSGSLNAILLKPISIYWFYFFRQLSHRLFISFTTFIAVLIFILVEQPEIFIQTSLLTNLLTLGFLLLGALLFIFMDMIVGMLAFWIVNTQGIRFVFNTILTLTTGGLFPLAILSSTAQKTLEATPIGIIMYFPLKVYFELVSTKQIISTLYLSLFWFFTLLLLYLLVWKKGIKVYGAYGN